MRGRGRHRGLTLLELAISLLLIGMLVSVLLPALSSARTFSYREQCSAHQRTIGTAWEQYLSDHDREFPFVPIQPGWQYGGVRFNAADGSPFPDFQRPLTPYMRISRDDDPDSLICRCPADRGITDPEVSIGTAGRTAFRSFGTSYRANALLLDARLAGLTEDLRGVRRNEITTASSRMILCGDPVWYEVAEQTGRRADWHGEPDSGNLLFLDGSVRFRPIRPRTIPGPIVYDPVMPGTAPREE